MAILEVGISLEMKRLVDIKYYSSSDNILDPTFSRTTRFLAGLESFITEAYGDEIRVISFSDFEIVCYPESIPLPNKETNNDQVLLTYAIIEKGLESDFVNRHLQEIIAEFLKMYDLNEIKLKELKYFKDFKLHVDKILGDLRFNTEDRIKRIFRD
ncbi:hypothetical protein LCGC14_0554290 [marine sediment metagenome]|uniref:Uncharacterized protein n=1 Tax=marine sediment metagenome TaxID=412755 RepID=A0A0F9RNW6_9ZZZZ|nr:MAG: hypothetical protein Lokiarch_27350 [Candidatus Lokiarchaeum sp. GC14_75]